MSRLPVIVSIGGINSAGRVSAHHAYRRLVIDRLNEDVADRTFKSLATLMSIDLNADNSLDAEKKQYILDHTLIRLIEKEHYDHEAVIHQHKVRLQASSDNPVRMYIKGKNLPQKPIPGMTVEGEKDGFNCLQVDREIELLLKTSKHSLVKAAAQLPTGFNPGSQYPTKSHPRALELSIYGASDAVSSLGISWQEIVRILPPDKIAVYANSALGQLDNNGVGGMFQAPMTDKRITSKHIPFSLADMPGNFVSAYILGNIGRCGANVGACASFLYNLGLAVDDIKTGRSRAVLVGAADAPILPEVIQSFVAMRSIANEENIKDRDSNGNIDYRKICRPFAENYGLTLAEAGVFTLLMDDELALSLGAKILGGVADVFVAADGFKSSITRPGNGNFITFGKATALANAILGEHDLKNRTYVHAHGTGTPLNRTTESHILSTISKAFGITSWPIAAIKSYLGHSMGVSSGDQLSVALGYWQDGIIPGIKSIDRIAADVSQDNLNFLLDHWDIDPLAMRATFINSKGFGGNNATGLILAPNLVEDMLIRKHGKKSYLAYMKKRASTIEQIQKYDDDCISGTAKTIYKYKKEIPGNDSIEVDSKSIKLPEYDNKISLQMDNPFPDMV